MTHKLDDIDIAIINSLLEDGRKSLRQIAKDTKISAPTVKIRFQRLVNVGLIKSFVPQIDTSKIAKDVPINLKKYQHEASHEKPKLKSGMLINMTCDLCNGPIGNKPHVLRFADIERFFCCITCKSSYKEKHKGRIDSLIKKSRS